MCSWSAAATRRARRALHFARYALQVTMVVREVRLTESCREYLIDRIRADAQIEVLLRDRGRGAARRPVLRAITLRNSRDRRGADRRDVLAVPLPRRSPAAYQWAAEVGIVRDDAGYLVTGPDLMRLASALTIGRSTASLLSGNQLPGVFAAGDVRHGSVKRFASAVGEGAMAVRTFSSIGS